MVKGRAALHRRFQRVPQIVRDELVEELERNAREIVAEMKGLAPIPEIAQALKWTWGDAPAGSLSIGTVGGKEYGKMKVTIYVERGPLAAVDAWFAHFFEFGTGPRVQKTTGRYTGYIPAQPFFWPIWRANKRRVKGRLSRAVTRALKKA